MLLLWHFRCRVALVFPFSLCLFHRNFLNAPRSPPPYPSFSPKNHPPQPFRFLEGTLLLWRLVWPPILGRRLWWRSFSVDRKAEKATYKVRAYAPHWQRIGEIEKERKKIVRVYRSNVTRRASWASCKKADTCNKYVLSRNRESKRRKSTRKIFSVTAKKWNKSEKKKPCNCTSAVDRKSKIRNSREKKRWERACEKRVCDLRVRSCWLALLHTSDAFWSVDRDLKKRRRREKKNLISLDAYL